MTAVTWAHDKLQKEWSQSRPGRVVDLPPADDVTFLKGDGQKKADGRVQDFVYVKDGGSQDPEPNGINWQAERRTTRLSIQVSTMDRRVQGTKVDGRERIFGYRNETDSVDQYGLDPGEGESYGGLTGEVRYIMDSVRKGEHEWDYILTPEVNDLVSTVGKNYYRASVELRLVELARALP